MKKIITSLFFVLFIFQCHCSSSPSVSDNIVESHTTSEKVEDEIESVMDDFTGPPTPPQKEQPIYIEFDVIKSLRGDESDILYAKFPEEMTITEIHSEHVDDLEPQSSNLNVENLFIPTSEKKRRRRSISRFVFHDEDALNGIPQQVVDLFLVAFDRLNKDSIFSNVVVPITIDLSWVNLSGNALGSAGPNFMFIETSTNLIYSDAQMNQIIGYDIFSDEADILININSAFPAWWVDANENPPQGTHDMLSVIVHEIFHGMGIIGLLRSDGSYASVPEGTRFQYDSQLYSDGGVYFDDEIPTGDEIVRIQFATGLTGDVMFKTLKGGDYHFVTKVYTPTQIISGSTLYHSNDLSAKSVMEASLPSALRRYNDTIDPITRSMLHSVGWNGNTCSLIPYESLCDHSQDYMDNDPIFLDPCAWTFDDNLDDFTCKLRYGYDHEDDDCKFSSLDDRSHLFRTNINDDGTSCERTREKASIELCVWEIINLPNSDQDDFTTLTIFVDDIDILVIQSEDDSQQQQQWTKSFRSVCVSDHYGFKDYTNVDTKTSILKIKGTRSLFSLSKHFNSASRPRVSIGISSSDGDNGEIIDLPLTQYEWKQSIATKTSLSSMDELWTWSSCLNDGMVKFKNEGLHWCRNTSMIYNPFDMEFRSISLCDTLDSLHVVDVIEQPILWSELFQLEENSDEIYFESLTGRSCGIRQNTPIVEGGVVCIINELQCRNTNVNIVNQ